MNHQFESLHQSGQIVSLSVAHFTKWILDNANHSVRMLMRDADAFDIVSKQLAHTNPKFKAAANWELHYVSRRMTAPIRRYSEHTSKENIEKLRKFLSNQNWYTQKYTIVDSGFMGSIPEELSVLGIESQSLMMFSGTAEHRGFYNELYPSNELFAKAKNICETVFESFPKATEKPTIHDIDEDGVLKIKEKFPHEIEARNIFADGLRAGAAKINTVGFDNIPSAKESIEIIENNIDVIADGIRVPGPIESPDNKAVDQYLKKLSKEMLG